jgi:hypothetical protein
VVCHIRVQIHSNSTEGEDTTANAIEEVDIEEAIVLACDTSYSMDKTSGFAKDTSFGAGKTKG